MRKFMTKEVTVTIAMMGVVSINENGLPEVTGIEHHEFLGDLTKEKVQKRYPKVVKAHNDYATAFNKELPDGVEPMVLMTEKTIFNVKTETRTYKMEVAEFIKVATLVTEADNVDEEEDEESTDNE